jgi:hypothetical protein
MTVVSSGGVVFLAMTRWYAACPAFQRAATPHHTLEDQTNVLTKYTTKVGKTKGPYLQFWTN